MDYQEVINGLQDRDVINLMTRLGADRYKETEDAIIFPTICHNVDGAEASMKLYYYKDSKIFYCYTCCGGQSIFKFLEHYYKARGIEYDWYNDVYLIALSCTPRKVVEGFAPQARELLRTKYEKKKKQIELAEYPEGILEVFVKEYPAQWLQDRISENAMDKFNILFSISQNKIIIPHYDVNGRLIGIRGRALNEWEVENVGKYMPVQIEQTWYKHPLSLNLYGLNVTKENIKKSGIVYIFESEKSVLQFEDFNMPNCAVAVCGSSLNKFQVDILMRECAPSEFIVCFDKEKDDNDEYFNKLYKMCKKYNKYANFSFLYDFDGLLNLKDSPSDRGEETFRKLLNRRVRVQ
jgi:DNA primase